MFYIIINKSIMKSLSLLKKIALGSGVVAAVTPIALMSTSCAIEDIGADYIEFNSVLHEKDYSKANVGTQSFKRLLFGSKKVFDGNYILFTGSNMSPATCKFYSGSSYLRSRDNWFKTSTESDAGHFWEGDFFLGIEKTEGTAIKNFGIFNVIDFWDGKVYDNKGHEITVCAQPDVPTQVFSPFAKWTDAMITQTKLYNKAHKYEWDEKSVTTKDYIRNDASAVAYRAFINTALSVYPVNDKRKKSFDVSDNNTAAKMLVFVDGVLQVTDKEKNQDIWDIPSSSTAWQEMIIKYFKDEEKKPEPEPTPPKPTL